jgi:hypothetical protein
MNIEKEKQVDKIFKTLMRHNQQSANAINEYKEEYVKR